MPELLIELFSEEIPARMQARAAEDLRRLVTDRLKAAGLAFTDARAYVTPRRLALVVDGVPVAQQDVNEEKKGPRVGSPDKAIEGFLKGAGLASLDQCEKRDTGKGEFWFAVVERRGKATSDVLPEIIAGACAELPWPKSMRWGAGTLRWVRPLHSMVGLFDGAVVPFCLGDLVAGDSTEGHRFMGKGRFAVKDFADYKAKLLNANVMLDAAERAAAIKAGIASLAAKEGLTPVAEEGLLAEVAGLVEWPVPLMGHIDERFMDVPREVLTTSMRVNQKYFTFNKPDGSMAPRFAVIANMLTEDGGQTIVGGNEKVLSARLFDARFFWDLDRRARLESRVEALKGIVFHAKLGTVFEKMERVRKLAIAIAPQVGADAKLADRAATLAKADLSTGMVGEFPELQGVMGRYYAKNDGESEAVFAAIAEHYSPLGPGDNVPTAPVSMALALADKLDTLIGFFAIDEKPTGSKDPFALRRAALGVIRIILENEIRLPLRRVGVPTDLFDFFVDRLKVYLRDRGVRHDHIAAVLVQGDDDLVRVVARVEAVKRLLEAASGSDLLAAYRRAGNILRIEEKKDGSVYSGAVNVSGLVAPEEKSLVGCLDLVAPQADKALEAEDFGGAAALLGQLRDPLDAFFERVTVNADDPGLRANRLNLLARIRAELNKIADLSQIEG